MQTAFVPWAGIHAHSESEVGGLYRPGIALLEAQGVERAKSHLLVSVSFFAVFASAFASAFASTFVSLLPRL